MPSRAMVAVSVVATVATLAAWGTGCGGNSATVSCSVSQDEGVVGVLRVCLEAPASTFAHGCPVPVADGGIEVGVTDGPCSRVDAVGGCRITTGAVSETIWYYRVTVDGGANPTSSDVQMLCAEGGATFVAP